MVSRSFITALALLGGVEAHTRMVELFRNGEGEGEAVGIRMDLNGDTTTAPITDLTSTDMACGKNGLTSVDRTIKLSAGDGIVMSHRSWADGAQPGVIDSNHKGSTAVYLKKVADAGATDPWATGASGEGWFKISWNGLDVATSQWGVDVMINNGGYTGAILPADLSEGYYLVRDEVLGLQNRDGGNIVPQFFVGCAQVYISGGTGGETPETVSIPGYVSASSPSLTYDIYSTPWGEFPEFGPEVYSIPVSAAAIKTAQLSASTTDVVGTCPSDTVLTVGNKCFTELTSWSDDTVGSLPKCWAASATCWEKNTDCWDGVEPVINGNDDTRGCNLWEAKCNALDAWCEAGNTSGPPDAGKIISEPLDLSGL
ncbi:hypothetical protein Daus18300_006582 [Diaporthe australafricana]|uniref:lytic cellulose monooxygenase (C4-dehydrogenating) n=1 Tax=Diaporthe australafricana TaxID=127596 RepID=A0ABR3WTU1_9PEZI